PRVWRKYAKRWISAAITPGRRRRFSPSDSTGAGGCCCVSDRGISPWRSSSARWWRPWWPATPWSLDRRSIPHWRRGGRWAFFVGQVVAAMVAGNTVVAKAAEIASLVARRAVYLLLG